MLILYRYLVHYAFEAQVGIGARKQLEAFFAKKVHVETFVKVKKNWRDNDLQLKRFGYKN